MKMRGNYYKLSLTSRLLKKEGVSMDKKKTKEFVIKIHFCSIIKLRINFYARSYI